MHVVLSPDRVEASVQESEIDNDSMLDCLCGAIESVPFPVSDRPAEFRVPFRFRGSSE